MLKFFLVKSVPLRECHCRQQENAGFYEEFLSPFTANEAALRADVRRLVPTRHDAADVMQGIALVLWKKFGDLDSPENFRKWAFAVARYKALMWLRDKARDRRVLANDLLNTIAHEAALIMCQVRLPRTSWGPAGDSGSGIE